MVCDLSALQRLVDDLVVEPFDHTFLNKDVPFFAECVPTAENIALHCRSPLHPGESHRCPSPQSAFAGESEQCCRLCRSSTTGDDASVIGNPRSPLTVHQPDRQKPDHPDALSRPFVRLVLAISLDGRLAPPGGGAAQLGGRGDRRALEESLAWADACLIGAGTLRAHQCTCLIRDADLLETRRGADRSAQPIAIVVSRSSGFSLDWPFFQQPLERWLLSSATIRRAFTMSSNRRRLGRTRSACWHNMALIDLFFLAGLN